MSALTLARRADGKVLCKHIKRHPGGGFDIDSAANSLWFYFEPSEFETIEELHDLVIRCEQDNSVAFVYGPLRDDLDPRQRHRRTKEVLEDPLTDVLVMDVDSIHGPDGLDWRSDPRGAAEHVLSVLPTELAESDCVMQWTASQGFKTGLRMRLFFLLDGKWSLRDLRMWLKPYQVDCAIYSRNQLIYTGRLLGAGVEDPIPGGQRTFLFKGAHRRVEPILVPEVRRPKPRDGVAVLHDGTDDLSSFDDSLKHINEDSIYGATMSAIGVYFATTENPDLDWLEATLSGRLLKFEAARDADYIKQTIDKLPGAITAIADKEAKTRASRVAFDQRIDLDGISKATLLPEAFIDACALAENLGANNPPLTVLKRLLPVLLQDADIKATPSHLIKGAISNADLAGYTPTLTEQEFLADRLEFLTARAATEVNELRDLPIEKVSGLHVPSDYKIVKTLAEVADLIGEPYSTLVVKAPHAEGKTELIGAPLAAWAKREGKSFLAITHRMNLARDLSGRLSVPYYKHELFNGKASMCINTLLTPRYWDAIQQNGVQVLFIDEVLQVLTACCVEGTVDEEDGPKIFGRLCRLVAEAEVVVVADADINQFCMEFATTGRKQDNRILAYVEPEDKGLKVDYTFDQGRIVFEAANALAGGGRAVIACTTVKEAEAIERACVQKCKDLKVPCTSLLVTRESCGDQPKKGEQENVDGVTGSRTKAARWLADPGRMSKELGINLLVHSPKLQSGTSITSDWFTHGLGVFTQASIGFTDAVQMLRRVRTLKSWTVCLGALPNREGAITKQGYLESMQMKDIDWETMGDLAADIKASAQQQRANFNRGFLTQLRRSQYTVSLCEPMGGDFGWRNALKDVSDARRQQVLDAPVIGEVEMNERYLTNDRTHEPEFKRAVVCDELGLPPSKLTLDFIKAWDAGLGDELARFAMAFGGPLIGSYEVRFRWHRLARQVYKHVWGQVAISAAIHRAQCQWMLHRLDSTIGLAADLGLCPRWWTRSGSKYTKKPMEGVKKLLSWCGLNCEIEGEYLTISREDIERQLAHFRWSHFEISDFSYFAYLLPCDSLGSDCAKNALKASNVAGSGLREIYKNGVCPAPEIRRRDPKKTACILLEKKAVFFPPRRLNIEPVCAAENCDKTFTPRNKNQRFCCPKCRRPKPGHKVCVFDGCHTRFLPKSNRQKYCASHTNGIEKLHLAKDIMELAGIPLPRWRTEIERSRKELRHSDTKAPDVHSCEARALERLLKIKSYRAKLMPLLQPAANV